jgi:cytochrome c oxidase subunit II
MLTLNPRRAMVVALAAVVAGAAIYAATSFAERSMPEQVFKMTVKRFEYSLRDIHVKKGVPVVLEITSLDVPHGFNLPDFHVRADALPGQVARVRFVPDRTGTFTFRCDVFCGIQHEELDGTLTVTE